MPDTLLRQAAARFLPVLTALLAPAAALAQDGASATAAAPAAAPAEAPVAMPTPVAPVPADAPMAMPAPIPAVPDAGTAVDAASAAATAAVTLPHDLTPLGMFLAASPVVQAVMVGLALASIATWTVWLAKTLELAAAKRQAREGLAALEEARSLAQAAERIGFAKGPVADLLRATIAEVHLSQDVPGEGLKERAASRMERIEAAAGRRMMRGTGLLASIGSTAPFIGLFGTVWGIMNSFVGIAKAHTTNLAVVAPGIAEALLATAIGLVAAIPAVVVYNIFSRSIGGWRAQLADASASVLRHLSRDIDRRALPRVKAAE